MKLEDLPKRNIHSVPPHYFEKLPGVVMARVQENIQEEQITLRGKWRYSYLRSALAGLVLILTFTFIFRLSSQPTLNKTSADLLARISDTEALNYLLTTEKLETPDLSFLSQANTDLSHEFIQLSRADVLQELEEVELEQLDLN